MTSATQITTLRSSSLHLSSSLKSISRACANPGDTTLNREDVSDTAETETADIMSVLPVAAHVKLLLDAPEGAPQMRDWCQVLIFSIVLVLVTPLVFGRSVSMAGR